MVWLCCCGNDDVSATFDDSDVDVDGVAYGVHVVVVGGDGVTDIGVVAVLCWQWLWLY